MQICGIIFCRVMGTGSNLYKQHNTGVDMLEKMWTKLYVQPMCKKELADVIVTKFQKLDTVVDKLIAIYLLLSAGEHKDESMETDDVQSDAGKFQAKDGRLISTR